MTHIINSVMSLKRASKVPLNRLSAVSVWAPSKQSKLEGMEVTPGHRHRAAGSVGGWWNS